MQKVMHVQYKNYYLHLYQNNKMADISGLSESVTSCMPDYGHKRNIHNILGTLFKIVFVVLLQNKPNTKTTPPPPPPPPITQGPLSTGISIFG